MAADDAAIQPHLEALVASDEPMPDRYQAKYLPPVSMPVKVTGQITAELPIGPLGAALMLAEVYQASGRLDEAIGLVQQLASVAPDDPVVRLSLCDLLLDDADYDGVLEASAGAVNDGDLGVATLHLRGAALFGVGALPARTLVALREQRRRQLGQRLAAGRRWRDNGLVFTTATGGPMDASAVVRQYHAATDRLGLPAGTGTRPGTSPRRRCSRRARTSTP